MRANARLHDQANSRISSVSFRTHDANRPCSWHMQSLQCSDLLCQCPH